MNMKKNANLIIEPNVRTIDIPVRAVMHQDISIPHEIFHEELRWDTLTNYRSIHFAFDKSLSSSAINKWFSTLIITIPEYMYYLSKENVMTVLRYFNEDYATLNTLMQGKVELAKYILSSLEELARSQDEIKPLYRIVYQEMKQLLNDEGLNEDEEI